jgi:MYXO-CTERM domain-containing protein
LKRILTTAVVAAAATFGMNASAGSVTWTQGNDGKAYSHTYNSHDNVEIKATAKSKSFLSSNWQTSKVGEYSSGLGISSHFLDSHQVDGKIRDEVLFLHFDQEYIVEGILFSYVDHNDDVKVYSDDSYVGTHDLGNAPSHGGYAYLDLGGMHTSKLGLGAFGSNDNWKVAGVKGHAVPTPSAALAGMLGLMGVAARRRRNAQA